MRIARYFWIARGWLVILSFLLAIYAFRMGVGVSARDGVIEGGWLTHTYYAIGLFVLGGIDLGMPEHGPLAARVCLWISYFLAPLITTSAVLEAAVRVFSPSWLVRVGMREHVVIVGLGRLGMLFLERLRQCDQKLPVVVLDREARTGNVEQAERRLGAHAIVGDVRTMATLDSLALKRARAVALFTDDDLVNLEAAWQIAKVAPKVRVLAHVSDMNMWRAVTEIQREKRETRVRIFNGHRIAAERLHSEYLEAYFTHTRAQDIVVLAGLGRFGQTILEHLYEESADQLKRVIIVDVAAEKQVRAFASQVERPMQCALSVVEGDADDPLTWQQVASQIDVCNDVQPVFILGTDDDRRNLHAGVALRAQYPDAPIFIRCVNRSSFTKELSQQLNIQVVAVDQMLRDALRQEQISWVLDT